MNISLILLAICSVESNSVYNSINISDKGSASYGCHQVKYNTAKMMGFKGSITELWFNKETNKKLAEQYLLWQYSRYGTWEKAIAAFNSGSIKLNKKGEFVNKKYVKKVLKEVERLK